MEGNSDKNNKKDQNIDFVLLIEENNVVLEKSQLPSIKKRKDAIAIIIEKWSTMSGVTLTHESFLKKLNNVKGRARSALNKGNPLAPWQRKILAMTTAVSSFYSNNSNNEYFLSEIQDDGPKTASHDDDDIGPNSGSQPDSNAEISNQNGDKTILIEVLATGPSMGGDKVEGFLNKFETNDAKYLTTEQLQRVALLQRIKIQALKQKKWEMQVNNPNFSFDFSAFNPLNVSATDLI